MAPTPGWCSPRTRRWTPGVPRHRRPHELDEAARYGSLRLLTAASRSPMPWPAASPWQPGPLVDGAAAQIPDLAVRIAEPEGYAAA